MQVYNINMLPKSRLTFIESVNNKNGLFKCECGKTTISNKYDVKRGQVKSCGCLRREIALVKIKKLQLINITHGFAGSRFYNIYLNLNSRCNSGENPAYKNYGGRGIKCLWNSFEQFKDDMYKSYLEHIKTHTEKNTSVDRIDNNGNYCKGNCRWLTLQKQNLNRRSNINLEINGDTKCLKEWTDLFQKNYMKVYKRIKRGWSIEEALDLDYQFNMPNTLNKELLEKAKQDNIGHAEELVKSLNASLPNSTKKD